ncbi:regulator of G-protein signaling 14, partial [Chanos chanos]|uniref:Regulator of G-protein signaling 14 n=1 Tax=Chanos chanos TaxID=29144 RepID=A0A6J2W4A1_CHACN
MAHRQRRNPQSNPEKRTMSFQEFTRGISSHFTLRSSLRRRLRRRSTLTSSHPLTLTKSLAVSDGELNVMEPEQRSGGQCSNSNTSLPSVPSDGASGVGQVASWAVSFERLLEDPLGVQYFTAFLKSEVSAENILFWQACEKFRKIPADRSEQLLQQALSIYNTYLSNNATSPINIDDKVRVEEKDIKNPHPDIFQKAQQQIFKLMKFDSYARFVRSQLYQSCMLANVEGRALPEIGHRSKIPVLKKADVTSVKEQQKPEQKAKEKSDGAEKRKTTLPGRIGWEKRKEKRGSWGESQNVGKSKALRNTTEAERLPIRTHVPDQALKAGVDKYCCVYLPDGTASLTPARPGLTIRSMLTGLCEKRGLPLTDIIIYLQGKDKHPLSLDQDSSVLKDQQVFLELRVTFAVEVAFTGKTVGMMVKSNKTLQEALAVLLNKHRLRPQDCTVTMSGSGEVVSMNTVATSLANKTLVLDRVKGPDQASSSKVPLGSVSQASFARRAGIVELDLGSSAFYRANVRQRNPAARRTYDVEGLVELLNRAQGCSADDQRGLLRKEHLMLPQFLQLPLEEALEEEKE